MDRSIEAAGAHEAVKDVRGVRARLHEDALFQQRIGQGKRPHRRGAFQMKSLDVAIALRSDHAASPAIGSQLELLAAVHCRLVQLRQQQRPPKRRLQCGDQQSVVAARLETRDRSERISANAVGHQPLARFRRRKIAADFATEIDHGRKGGHIAIGGTVHRANHEAFAGRLGPEKNRQVQREAHKVHSRYAWITAPKWTPRETRNFRKA